MAPYYPSVPRGRLRNVINMAAYTRPFSSQMVSGLSGPEAVERRLRNIDIIEHLATGPQRFVSAKPYEAVRLTLNAAAGMVANAWAESRLDELAVNPSESAFGLFQLTGRNFTESPGEDGRLRKGTRFQRWDPIHNTNYMLWEAYNTPYGYWFRVEDRAGKQPDRMAWIFARDLERCARCGKVHYGLNADGTGPRVITPSYNPDGNTSELRARAAFARLLFPTLHGAGAQEPPPAVQPTLPIFADSKLKPMSWVLLAGTLLAVANVDRIDRFMKGS